MAECPGGDPAHRFAIVPDRLIADRVGVGRVDLESHQAQYAAALLLFGGRRAADELPFLQVDESIEASLKGTIDGAVLARPAAEAFFDAHRVQRAPAEVPELILPAGSEQLFVQGTLIV